MSVRVVVAATLSLLAVEALADDGDDAPKSAEAVARELANPNTALAFLSFPIDYID